MLLRAGFYKSKGLTSVQIILELCISVMLNKTKLDYVLSKRSAIARKLSKTALYRYVAKNNFAWRAFYLQLAAKLVSRVSKLTSEHRKECFIIDDSIFNRDRSKKTEMLTKVYDHCSHRYRKGFTYLMLSWTDGNSTFPVDWALMSSVNDKNCINKVDIEDRRTSVAKRMMECRKSKPEVVIQLLDSALNNNIFADYVLFDTWFTTAPLITAVRERGLHVIGMLKHMQNSSYLYQGTYYTLKALLQKIERTPNPQRD